LREESEVDTRFGGVINADIAEYVVPVNADIGAIEVGFIDEPDPLFNSAGVKGVGEVSRRRPRTRCITPRVDGCGTCRSALSTCCDRLIRNPPPHEGADVASGKVVDTNRRSTVADVISGIKGPRQHLASEMLN